MRRLTFDEVTALLLLPVILVFLCLALPFAIVACLLDAGTKEVNRV